MLRSGVSTVAVVLGTGLLTAQQQQEALPSRQQTSVSVPFVGCQSDGQAGPRPAPNGQAPALEVDAKSTQLLAYYSSAERFGVLAPRNWHCFGTYGSGGEHLYVSPERIDAKMLFSDKWGGFLGPAIQLDYRYGGTSGRFAVADVIARVFPAYKWFAIGVMKELISPRFSFGPYPDDALTYKSKTVVEYNTPAQTDGLGTLSSLKKTESPIQGVVLLVERSPDLMQLAVRLPPDLNGLTPAIIHQVEREAEHLPQPPTVQ